MNDYQGETKLTNKKTRAYILSSVKHPFVVSVDDWVDTTNGSCSFPAQFKGRGNSDTVNVKTQKIAYSQGNKRVLLSSLPYICITNFTFQLCIQKYFHRIKQLFAGMHVKG